MKKKHGSILVAVMLLLLAMVLTVIPNVYAMDNFDMVYHQVEDGSFYFDKLSGNIVSFTPDPGSDMVAVSIPSEIEGIAVTGIGNLGEAVFREGSRIEEVVLPETLKTIGMMAFSGCAIHTLEIHDGVTTIGMQAFSDSAIEYITIPASVEKIAHAAFTGCTKLHTVTFEGNAPVFGSDGDYVANFNGVEATIYYPANNDTWTEAVMQNYGGNLTWVEGTNVVEYPVDGGYLVFDTVNREIVRYEGQDFEKKPLNIVIPAQIAGVPVEKIGDGGDFGVFFDANGRLESLTMPEGLKEIGVCAFELCPIKEITIPSSVTRIGSGAFWGCEATGVTIPAGVTEIGAEAFTCPVFVDEDNQNYSSNAEGALFNKDQSVLICGAFTVDGICTVPASVKRIEDGAFNMGGVNKVVYFKGDAPVFGTEENADAMFYMTSATVYYPADNATWTADVMQDYGGTLTWCAYQNYAVLNGADAVLKEDAEGHTIRVAGEIDKFLNVYLNGALVDPANYTVTEGSTVITFSKEFLATLEPGEYTVQVCFEDGIAQTTMTIKTKEAQKPVQPSEPAQPTEPAVPDNPETGTGEIAVPMALLVILSMTGVVITAFGKKRLLP